MLQFDHIIIGVQDLNEAIRNYTDLGFNVVMGGEHASGTTHNALIVFRDGTYIELIARTGKPLKQDSAAIAQDFSGFLHDQEGFVGYALYTSEIDETLHKLKAAGITVMSDATHGQRVTKEGVTLRWQMSFGCVDGVTLILICDETSRQQRIPTTLRNVTHPNGANGVKSVVHVAKEPELMRRWLQAVAHENGDDTFALAQSVKVMLRPPDTDMLTAHHDKFGDSVWRVVLSGLGEMYKRLDAQKLHGADVIIVGGGNGNG
jgi:catechol 2,3-dioxygenase-like lactoylglutathione lyase family enzyme